MGIGTNLKKIILAKNISISDLAKRAGVPRSTLYATISRDSNSMDSNTLSKICAVLECSADDLLANSPDNLPGYIDSILNESDYAILNPYRKLNIKGQEKVVSYAYDLLYSIRDYRKE